MGLACSIGLSRQLAWLLCRRAILALARTLVERSSVLFRDGCEPHLCVDAAGGGLPSPGSSAGSTLMQMRWHLGRWHEQEQEQGRLGPGGLTIHSESTSVVDEDESPRASRPASSGRQYTADGGKLARARHAGHEGAMVKGSVAAAHEGFHRKTPQKLGSVVFCGECGEPNKGGVLYCSCGEPLAEDDDYSSPTRRPPARENLSDVGSSQNVSEGAGDAQGRTAASNFPGQEGLAVRASPDGRLAKEFNEEGEEASHRDERVLQRHRGAPKIALASSPERGQGGWRLLPEPKDESEDEDSPRGRQLVRERERELAQEIRDQAALSRFQDGSADTGPASRSDHDDDGPRSGGETGMGAGGTGATAETETVSVAGEEPAVKAMVRGDAARRHRRAPLDKGGALPAAANVAEVSDSTKMKALEEADEMMMMLAPPKRSVPDISPNTAERPASGGGRAADSFLVTLGMPKSIPEGRWGEGAEESDDEQRRSPARSKVVGGGVIRKGASPARGQGPAHEKEWGDKEKGNIFGQGNQMLLQDKKHVQQARDKSHGLSHGANFNAGGGVGKAQGQGASQDLENSFETQADTVVTKVSTVSAAVMDPAVIRALREAKALLDDGVLTADEFQHQKRIILQGGANPYGVQQPPATRDGSILAYDEGTPTNRMPGHGAQPPQTSTSESHFTARPQVYTADSSQDREAVRWAADGQGGRRAQWAPRVDKSGLVVPVKEGPPLIQMKAIRPTSSSTTMSRDEGDAPLQQGGAQVLTMEALERHQAAEAARTAAPEGTYVGEGPGDAHNHQHRLPDSKDQTHEPRTRHEHAMPAAPRRGKGKMLADPQGALIPESRPHVAAGAVDDTPLFMRDHNEEVERLRRQAEQELESAELEALAPEPEYLDAQGLRNAMAQRRQDANAGAAPRAAIDTELEEEDELVVTDGAIRDAWRQRESQILQTMSDPVPSWADMPPGGVRSVESILVERQVKPASFLLVATFCNRSVPHCLMSLCNLWLCLSRVASVCATI